MSTTGPVLPPHLQPKRKRSRDEDASPPPRDATSSDPTTKKARTIIGPASPPAPLDQRPSHPAESTADDASTSSEDDYGPALPSAHDPAEPSLPAEDDDLDPAEDDTPAQPTKRDEWMMLPPDKDDLSARMDPTKIRARKFNSGVGAKGGGGHTGVSSSGAWTETPQQKQKRLQDEVLGLSQAERPAPPSGVGKGSRKGDDVARKVQEHNEKHWGKSLYEQHKEEKGGKKEEDDPSKRAFDYERDMKGGGGVGRKQQKDLINRAGNIGSKFSRGSFL